MSLSSLCLTILIVLNCGMHFAEANWQMMQMESVKQREADCLKAAFQARLELLHQMLTSTGNETATPPAAQKNCPVTFDGFICWPQTVAGSSLRLPCPSRVFESGLATRSCREDGTWDSPKRLVELEAGSSDRKLIVLRDSSYTNYSGCPPGGLYDAMKLRKLKTDVSEVDQKLRVEVERQICQQLQKAYDRRDAGSKTGSSTGCPPAFDGVICWQGAPAGSRVFASCPSHLNDLARGNLAWRTCLDNGTWFWPDSVMAKTDRARGEGWTNFSDCHATKNSIPFAAVVGAIHTMGHVGYGLSMAALLLAILILTASRRLHCEKNSIHINLFVAFLLRGVTHFVAYFVLDDEASISCRVNQALMTFSVFSSSAWVSVEALHLYMLIFVNTMSTSKLTTPNYMAIGWGVPAIFTLVWVILRLSLNNSFCWRSYKAMGADIWVLNVYLCLLVFINAGLFGRIVRELFVKIKSQPRSSVVSQSYSKLWKSTSVLVVVFGIYYIIFLPMSVIPKDKLGFTLDCIKLFYEHFFTSFQGFFVSLLFCFVNAEVNREQKRLLMGTRAGRWLKTRGFLKPPTDAYGLELENRRNNRRARRSSGNGFQTETSLLQQQQPAVSQEII